MPTKKPISTKVNEVLTLRSEILKIQNLPKLLSLYKQFGDYNHPQICCDFGIKLFLLEDKPHAKEAWIKGALFGLEYPHEIYDNSFIDSLGQCFSLLITQFPIGISNASSKIISLGYIYLSRCIELHPQGAYDSYKTRGQLIDSDENSQNVQGLIWKSLGLGFLHYPFIISDFYYASTIPGSPHSELLTYAQKIQNSIEGISIGGKHAEEYSLGDLAEFGKHRHNKFFKILENEFKLGQLELTETELKKAYE